MGESLKNRYATKIEAASLVDQLVDRIRDNIVSGSFTPGARIKVKEIAEDHGVSMIPVREALARLLASRLVRAEANRGYFVASRPAPEEYAELVKARELLETSALAAGFNRYMPRLLWSIVTAPPPHCVFIISMCPEEAESKFSSSLALVPDGSR